MALSHLEAGWLMVDNRELIGGMYKLEAIVSYNTDGSITRKDTHLLILDIRRGLKYRDCDTFFHCLALETGKSFDIYTDVLLSTGVRVS